MIEILIAALIFIGALLGAIGALGVIRLPDVLIRMHASTKIGTLSCGLIMAGTAIWFGDRDVIIRAVAIILFILLTAPIAAHMIGRAAVATGVPLWNTRDLADEKTMPEKIIEREIAKLDD